MWAADLGERFQEVLDLAAGPRSRAPTGDRPAVRLPEHLRVIADLPGGERSRRCSSSSATAPHGDVERLRPPVRGRPGPAVRAPRRRALGNVSRSGSREPTNRPPFWGGRRTCIEEGTQKWLLSCPNALCAPGGTRTPDPSD